MKNKCLLSTGLLITIKLTLATELNIAVASNFVKPLKQIVQLYNKDNQAQIQISTASTGVLYNQIKNGAPFDILLAADDIIPQKLVNEKLAIESTNFTYAVGRVVLWSRKPNYVDESGVKLNSLMYNHIAIANPKLAPYGIAGYQTINYFNLGEKMKLKIVSADNINSTYQIVASGNAELGFVALSQVMQNGKLSSGSAWIVPENIAHTIKQNAIVLSKSTGNAQAYNFINFLKSKPAQQIIHSYGYQ